MPKIDCKELEHQITAEKILLDKQTILGICAALNTNKNMMFAGVPGTAKTKTAEALAKIMFGKDIDKRFQRVTAYPGIARQEFFGDWNYQKQLFEIQQACSMKLDTTGAACTVKDVKDLFREENFNKGPALKAVENEGMLFIDEANRGEEDFQNLVLEIAEEKQVTIPMLKTIGKGRGAEFPLTIVTYNEQDIGTQPFSDAFKRRFMRIKFNPLKLSEQEKVINMERGRGFLDELNDLVGNIGK